MKLDAYQYSIRLLSQRDYPRKKLIEKLISRGFETEEIFDAITELKEVGLFDENRYAEARIKGLIHKGWSKSFITKKMGLEGVEVTPEMLERCYRYLDITEYDQAEKLLIKKIKNINDLSFNDRQKATRYALSKGHSFDKIKEILESLSNHPQ